MGIVGVFFRLGFSVTLIRFCWFRGISSLGSCSLVVRDMLELLVATELV